MGFTDKEVEESSSQDGGGRGKASGDETKLAGTEARSEQPNSPNHCRGILRYGLSRGHQPRPPETT